MYKLKYRRKQIAALKILLEGYKDPSKASPTCPLCGEVRGESGCISCIDCVWTIETGQGCEKLMDYYENKHDACNSSKDLRGGKVKQWTKRRLREIPKWIEKYSEK